MARFRGTAGNDRFTGSSNQDNSFFDFGQGQDVLTGGNRKDIFSLTVDKQADLANGGNGIDTVDYTNADRGLEINLHTGVTFAKFLGEARPVEGGNGWISGYEHKIVTELLSIENVVGSRYGDVITGSASDNVIEGGGGADLIDGGAGRDTVSYEHSSSGVTIDLSPQDLGSFGRGRFGDAEGDRFTSIENVIGSQHNDRIIGSGGDNELTGGAGTDVFVFGRGIGHDTITDFDATGSDHDFLQFEHHFRNFQELREHAEAHGNDVVITIDEHNSITLENVRLNQLDDSDFLFL